MLQTSEIRLIENYLSRTGKKEVTISELRLNCGLPGRVKDKHLKDYFRDYKEGVNLKVNS